MRETIKVALFLGYKSIARGNRGTLALMIFILSLAFVNLVFISGILNGIVVALEKQIKTNLVSNIVIEPQEEPVKKDFIIHANELREEIERLPGVAKVVTRYGLSGTVAYDKEKNGKFKFLRTMWKRDHGAIRARQRRNISLLSLHQEKGKLCSKIFARGFARFATQGAASKRCALR